MSSRGRCVLGFAPHSGWAAVVVIGGTALKPLVLARERLELCDDRLVGSKQPYHAIEGLTIGEARSRLESFRAASRRLAASGIRALAHTARAAEVDTIAGAILDASGRSGATLEAILASHALIHTADGNHFREALEAGCAAQGLDVTRIGKRDLPALAVTELGHPEEELRAVLAQLGREMGAPWGADQKGAALLAWLVLARLPRATGRT